MLYPKYVYLFYDVVDLAGSNIKKNHLISENY